MPYRRNGARGFNHPRGKHPHTFEGGVPGDLSAPPRPSERSAPAGLEAMAPILTPRRPGTPVLTRLCRVGHAGHVPRGWSWPWRLRGCGVLCRRPACAPCAFRGQCPGQPCPTGPASRPRTRAGAWETGLTPSHPDGTWR